MSYINSPVIYKDNEVFYFIDDNSRKHLCNLFDCLGNIASYNDYYSFLKRYPRFYRFNFCSCSRHLKTKLTKDEYVLLILNQKTKKIYLPNSEHYEYFYSKYNNAKNKIIKSTEKPLETSYTSQKICEKPLEISYTPLEISYTQLETSEKTLETSYTPLEISYTQLQQSGKPLETIETAQEISYTQLEQSETLLETIETAQEISYTQLEQSEKPLETIETAIETSETSLETIETAIETSDIIENYLDNNDVMDNSQLIVKELFNKYNKVETQDNSLPLSNKQENEEKKSYINPIWKLFGW